MGLPLTGQQNWGIPLNAYITNVVLSTANQALSSVNTHIGGTDPHGDRAYAQGLVSPITSGVNQPSGFVKLQSNGLILSGLLPVGSIKTTFWDVKRDFGATGNGSTDDTTAIQNALTAALNAGGGEVWVPTGTYALGKQLIIGSNVWLHLSPGAVMKRIIPSVGPAPSIMIASANFTNNSTPSSANILISGGAWDATGNRTLTSACTPIMLIGGYFGGIQQTYFQGVAGSPLIELNGYSDVAIRDCEFTGNQVGSQSVVPAVRLNSTSTSTTPSGLAAGAYNNQACNNIIVQSCLMVSSSYSTYPPCGRLVGADLYAGYPHGNVTVTECLVNSSALLTSPAVDVTHINGWQIANNIFPSGDPSSTLLGNQVGTPSGMIGYLTLSASDETPISTYSGSITPITKQWDIPPNDAKTGTTYRLTTWGAAQFHGQGMYWGVEAFGNQIMIVQGFQGGQSGNYLFRMTGELFVPAAGSSGEAICEVSVLAWESAANNPAYSGNVIWTGGSYSNVLDPRFPVNTTVDSQFYYTWASWGGGQNVETYGSLFERLGP